MKLWTSGEVQADVLTAFTEARKQIEAAINEAISGKDYGTGLVEWAYLAIILAPAIDAQYPEVSKYRKGKRETEFRLKIDHQSFKVAAQPERVRMLFNSVARSLAMMSGLRIPNFELGALTKDVMAVGTSRGWA